ncbi:MAG: hypothetical protein ABI863_15430 [Ginsengibacter sp.]
MKKVLIVLSISAFFAACNGGSSSTDVKTDSTSTSVTTDTSSKMTTDTSSKMMGDTSKMKSDTAKTK